MKSKLSKFGLIGILLITVMLIVGTTSLTWSRTREGAQREFEITKIFFEYNSTANDLGVHVFVDGEDWTTLRIINPNRRPIFDAIGRGPYRLLGLTELSFEGAEPSLDEFPLEDLLALFPEGTYRLLGRTVDRDRIVGEAVLSHAIPAGPIVNADLNGNSLVISWEPVTTTPEGFPDRPINIVAFQVIVETFQVTVPATTLSVTVSPEFVASLPAGTHQFEVLAIDESGNQTITEGTFVKP